MKNAFLPITVTVSLFAMTAVVDASAGEFTWKGGGDTGAWSDGTNWEGGVAPGSGDVAVIPDGKEAVANGSTDVAALNNFAGITMEGDGSVLCLSNLEAHVTLTVPISGRGVFSVREQTKNDGTNYEMLTLNADNSNFSGIFSVTNAGLRIENDKALGGENGGPLHIATAGKQRLTLGGGYRTLYNDLYIKGTGYGNTLFIANNGGCWKGNIYIYNGFTFHANTSLYTFTIEGDVIFKAATGVSFNGSAGVLKYMGRISNPYGESVYGGGSIEIGGEPYSKNFGNLYATGTIKCLGRTCSRRSRAVKAECVSAMATP